ncbi:uncharacterized protein LOC120338264 [Styela clava]
MKQSTYFCILVVPFVALMPYCTISTSEEPRPLDASKVIIYPTATGEACSKKKEGITVYSSRNITISSDKAKKIAFRIPKNWKPGEYICNWNINIVRGSEDKERGPKRQVRLYFRRVFIGNRDENKFFSPCDDELTIKTEYNYALLPDNDLCGLDNGWVRKTGSESATMSLKVFVKENENENKTRTSFVAFAYSIPNYNRPMHFLVRDIIQRPQQNKYVLGANFTWEEARSFCMDYAEGWDLCKREFVCDSTQEYYLKNLDMQYFPVVDDHNYWEELQPKDCHNNIHYWYGPPVWGLDKRECPKEGCEAKAHIFCCPYKKLIKYNSPRKQRIFVKSYIDESQNYYYRFTDAPDIYEYEYDDKNWEADWKTTGRLSGDVVMFELFSQYSEKASVPLYFCSKYEDGSNLRSYRYLISRVPCKSPWEHKFHAYTSLTPQDGFKRLYFGQSNRDGGTRVSLKPFCCGFNKTEGSFETYGMVRKKWIANVPSEKCLDQNIHSGLSGVIKSPMYPEHYDFHTTCNWRIRVSHGSRVLLQFSQMELPEFDKMCWTTYLEITDSKRSYGKVCANSLPEEFISYSNELNVHLVSEKGKGRFIFNYTEVSSQKSEPLRLELPSNEATWSAAKILCESNKKSLCRKRDLCPYGMPFGGEASNTTWVAVSDEYNDWMKLGPYDVCKSYVKTYGPPEWGEKVIEDCEPLYYDGETDECLLSRKVVFCCDRPEGESEKDLLESVRVNVGYAKWQDNLVYFFQRGNVWESPEYLARVGDGYDYYHDWDYYGEREKVYPYKLISENTNARPGTVDYFIMSAKYEETYFNQVIYFCWKEGSIHSEIRRIYKMSMNSCEAEDDWKFDFFLYAGRNKSEKTPTALHIGLTNSTTGSFCCENNAHNFTIFVISSSNA